MLILNLGLTLLFASSDTDATTGKLHQTVLYLSSTTTLTKPETRSGLYLPAGTTINTDLRPPFTNNPSSVPDCPENDETYIRIVPTQGAHFRGVPIEPGTTIELTCNGRVKSFYITSQRMQYRRVRIPGTNNPVLLPMIQHVVFQGIPLAAGSLVTLDEAGMVESGVVSQRFETVSGPLATCTRFIRRDDAWVEVSFDEYLAPSPYGLCRLEAMYDGPLRRIQQWHSHFDNGDYQDEVWERY